MGNVMYLPERVLSWYTDLYSDIYGNRLELIMHHKVAFMINLFYPIKQERSFKHEMRKKFTLTGLTIFYYKKLI